MSDASFPARKSKDARRTDEDLVETLRHMIDTDETVTARAVARRMHSISQPSTLTRDPWRMARIGACQAEQIGGRAHAGLSEHHDGGAPSDIWNRLSHLRGLRYFIGVAHAGNLGAAARELALSQPQLTRQIQRLEEELGTGLFVRHGRGVTLTRQGSRLLERLETVQHLLASTLEQRLSPGQSSGRVTLAVPAESGLLFLPILLEKLRARWPDTILSIQEGLSAAIEEWLVNRVVDIAVLEEPPSLVDIRFQPVLAAKLGLVAAPAFADAADPRPLGFRALTKIPLVLPTQQHRIRRLVDKTGFQHGRRLSPVLEADSLLLRKAVVRHGLACTVLPFIAVQEEIARGMLLFREIVQPSLVFTYSIASRATTEPVSPELVNTVRDAVISVIQKGVWAGVQTIGGEAPSSEDK